MDEAQSAMVLAVILLVTVIGWLVSIETKEDGYEQGYSQGFDDAIQLKKNCETTDDETKVKQIISEAMKTYIKDTECYERGDIKKIDTAEDIGELKFVIYEICISRKEKKDG